MGFGLMLVACSILIVLGSIFMLPLQITRLFKMNSSLDSRSWMEDMERMGSFFALAGFMVFLYLAFFQTAKLDILINSIGGM